VWQLLGDIPYGATSTYGEIAKKLGRGKPNPGMFVRAVAGAVGHNPVSLLIPCHRVIGADGSLKGYAGGIERKRALLELEGFYTI
jgi:methylated-DNA-[protein]-cysteine S-methyltransferase